MKGRAKSKLFDALSEALWEAITETARDAGVKPFDLGPGGWEALRGFAAALANEIYEGSHCPVCHGQLDGNDSEHPCDPKCIECSMHHEKRHYERGAL